MTLNSRNQRTLLFILAMACLLWAGGALYVDQQVAGLSLTLLLVGGLALLATFWGRGLFAAGRVAAGVGLSGAASRGIVSSPHIPARQWRRRAITSAVVILALAATVAINVATQALDYRWDLTAAQQHTLTPNSISYIKGLQQDVTLTALFTGLPPKYLQDLLNEYQRLADGNSDDGRQGKITIQIIDPVEQIGQAAQFGNVINSSKSILILQSGEERKDIDFTGALLTEEQVTNALVRVTRSQRQLYFLTGHGERTFDGEDNPGLSRFASLLAANNMHSSSLMLGIEGRIPEDCDVLIIAGPSSHFTTAEQALIDDYLLRGGDALLLVEHTVITSPDKPLSTEQLDKNPSLNRILNQWGLDVARDIVVDLSSHVGDDVGSPATKNYIAHKAITAGLDYSFYVRPRSIAVLPDRPEGIKLAPIVLTASKEKSWGESNRTLAIHYDEGIDRAGPVPISFVIWKEKAADEASDTRMIVFTDADFLSNAYIDQYSNAALGLNVVNWLAELDYSVFLDQPKATVQRLDLTSQQRRMITVLLFLMPLLIAMAGVLVWLRR